MALICEILFYYNPESRSDKLTLAYTQSVVLHVMPYPFGRTPSNPTSWQIILKALGMHPKDLLNKAHPYYQTNIRDREFDDEGWLNIIRYNPQLIKAPIAMRGNRAVLCNKQTDIYKLMELN
ncbi:MAG: glutaredoxin [Saprospiraceae bacterium]|nr:glutaredoxin [Saprospiraceae bacterium]